MNKELEKLKIIDLGCGRMKAHEAIGIDIVQCTDENGTDIVDIVMDIEKEPLPFADNSMDEVIANSVLEHVDDLKFVMNECWRVLRPGGILRGDVPICGTKSHYRDPTHRRCFIKETFSYFTGEGWHEGRPKYPRYADYGFLAWNIVGELGVDVGDDGEKREAGEMILFKMTPQK